VVVAVALMRMVQVPIHQIIRMVSMRHRVVAALGPVHMLLTMAAVLRGAPRGVLLTDRDDVLIHVIPMRAVQMPIVQIADMPLVLDRHMSAFLAVLVTVLTMLPFCARHVAYLRTGVK
jgi:hypothetical protein